MNAQDIFYVRPQDVDTDFLTLRKDEFHHLIHVLRKKTGDRFLAVDGEGTIYECLIEQLNHDALKSRILNRHKFIGEPAFKLALALAIPKKNRFDWVVEKCTEIGISQFFPLLTRRTIVKEKSVKIQRCTRIALAAMKQCRRSLLPRIEPPLKFSSLCKSSKEFNIKLLAHEQEKEQDLDDIFNKLAKSNPLECVKSGILCIGPEGGFTEEEVELAVSYGFSTFSLGARRLRSETAAIVGAALLMDKMGEFKKDIWKPKLIWASNLDESSPPN